MIYLFMGVTYIALFGHTACYAGRTAQIGRGEKKLREKSGYGVAKITDPEKKTGTANLIDMDRQRGRCVYARKV